MGARVRVTACWAVSRQQHYEQMRTDVAFPWVGGISVPAGLPDLNLDDAEARRVLVSSSRWVIVLADSRKIGQENFVQVAHLCSAHLLITDDGARPADVAAMRQGGPSVELVPAPRD